MGVKRRDETGHKCTLIEWVEAVRRKQAALGDRKAIIEHSVSHADEMAGAEIWCKEKSEDVRVNTRGFWRVWGDSNYSDLTAE